MRQAVQGTLAAIVMLSLGSCSLEEPRILGVLLWEGNESCGSCRAAAVDLMARPEDPMRMKLASAYTLEVRTDPGSATDRCIYRIVNASWIRNDLPREFNCFPVETIMLRPFSTPVAREATPEPRLTIAVNLYNAVERRQLATLFLRTYAVVWE